MNGKGKKNPMKVESLRGSEKVLQKHQPKSKTPRTGPPPEEPISKIPDGSVRTRCYRLNLEHPVCFYSKSDYVGPISYEPSPHHFTPRSSRRRVHTWTSA